MEFSFVVNRSNSDSTYPIAALVGRGARGWRVRSVNWSSAVVARQNGEASGSGSEKYVREDRKERKLLLVNESKLSKKLALLTPFTFAARNISAPFQTKCKDWFIGLRDKDSYFNSAVRGLLVSVTTRKTRSVFEFDLKASLQTVSIRQQNVQDTWLDFDAYKGAWKIEEAFACRLRSMQASALTQ